MKRIKVPRLFKARKLAAATARRASAASAGMDFEGIPEPNMKLSRALLIVLLLHVVAVSGIIAFNAIKTRERAYVPPTSSEPENKTADTTQTANHASSDKARVGATQNETDRQHDPKPSHSPAKKEQAKTPSSSGKTYVVKKGDNPARIAKKLKVSYSDLIAINHIDDPRKLKIGQKLRVPETAKPKTTSAKATAKKKKQNEISSEKSDAKTHRAPKAVPAKSTDTRASFRASFWSAQASSRRFHAVTPHAS
ncbi:MAG TPA: LysM peptidoglycan-binding domain-containing protein [Candidatus Udaeobacter sp.]